MFNDQNKNYYTPKATIYQRSVWIETLKTIYKVMFVAIILVGLIICVMLCSKDEVAGGLIVLAASIIIGVLSVGFVIVFLELAGDMRDTVNYVYQIGNMLEDDKNRNVSGIIENTAENIYQIKNILENNTVKKE